MHARLFIALSAAWLALGTARAQDAGEELFEARIRPLLADHCFECHASTAKRVKGGLQLDTRESFLRGGESGAVVVAGKPDESRLIAAVRYADEELQMPPKGRLDERAIADLVRWVELGAPFPEGATATRTGAQDSNSSPAAAYDFANAREHWAFRPPVHTSPPDVLDARWPANDIDRFILARLESAGLTPAPRADKRTLLIRASFDLIGLAPTAEDLDAFERDEAPDAWSRAVETLLASPHYGERWGRHWLDVARYADSNGLDENLAMAEAWRYRDYVVRAFNQDKPYDRFVLEQLAGDLLPPQPDPRDFDALIATGFLGLGPKMLAEQDKEKLVLDTVDEQLDIASRAFMGLTVGCARCHDHKFDPVPARDYYALAGIFKSTATLGNTDFVSRWRSRELGTPEEIAERAAHRAAVETAEKSAKDLEAQGEPALASRWRRELAALMLAGTRAAERSLLLEAEDSSRGNLIRDDSMYGSKDVVVARTGAQGPQFVEYDVTVPDAGEFDVSVRYAAQESRAMRLSINGEARGDAVIAEVTGGWNPDSQGWSAIGAHPLRAGRNVLRLERDGAVPHLDQLLLVPASDLHTQDALSPDLVRSWTAFAKRGADKPDSLFALWHRFAKLGEADFTASAAALQTELRAQRDAATLALHPLASQLVDAPPPATLEELAARYQIAFGALDLGLGLGLGRPEREPDEHERIVRDLLHGKVGPFALRRGALEALYPPELAVQLVAARTQLEELIANAPAPLERAIAVADGAIADLQVHVRGSHLNQSGEAIPRGFLEVFDNSVPAPDIAAGESGRLQFAQWLVHPEHPLTTRVIVNRIWAGHFGLGLVPSLSNFGARGDAPSHPELLDWLAREFQARGWSIKAMHRLILASSTYCMSSAFDARAAAVDPQNRLLWRMHRRRLEAELIRDRLLQAADDLDLAVGGSLLATKDGDYVTNDQSKDQARYASHRRSLYLPVIRNAMYELFSSFDYADPSMPIERRGETTVAHQALFFMNSPLAVASSAALARRVLASTPTIDDTAGIRAAWRLAFGRECRPDEVRRSLALLEALRKELREHPLGAGEPPSVSVDAGALVQGDGAPANTAEGTRSAGAERDPHALAEIETRAWQGLCHALVSSNEFVYVD